MKRKEAWHTVLSVGFWQQVFSIQLGRKVGPAAISGISHVLD